MKASICSIVFSLALLAMSGSIAHALDLNDFSREEITKISKEAPQYGGAILVKNKKVFAKDSSKPMPITKEVPTTAGVYGIEPAAGTVKNVPDDYAKVGGDSFAKAMSRFKAPGTEQKPVWDK